MRENICYERRGGLFSMQICLSQCIFGFDAANNTNLIAQHRLIKAVIRLISGSSTDLVLPEYQMTKF
jgi:hypothetical protein